MVHKPALERHLAQKWRDLFGAPFDLVLFDLTSTYLEGDGAEVASAKRGYSRDHRPDCLQVVLALIVTPEGFPLTYEVFPGNALDRTTLGPMLDALEAKHGTARRLWVFDRGVVSEDNLALLRERGAHYLVGTPKRQLHAYEQKLLDGPWTKASAEVEVQLVPDHDEVYVLCRSAGRKSKERAMRWRWLRGTSGNASAEAPGGRRRESFRSGAGADDGPGFCIPTAGAVKGRLAMVERRAVAPRTGLAIGKWRTIGQRRPTTRRRFVGRRRVRRYQTSQPLVP